jgi:hypothetical protein
MGSLIADGVPELADRNDVAESSDLAPPSAIQLLAALCPSASSLQESRLGVANEWFRNPAPFPMSVSRADRS